MALSVRRLVASSIVSAVVAAIVIAPSSVASASAASTNAASTNAVPSGQVIAYMDEDAGPILTIHTLNPTTGQHAYLISGSAPAWSQTGGRLAFVSTDNMITIRNANGTLVHTGVPMNGLGVDAAKIDWSPDGQHLVYVNADDVMVMNTSAPYDPHVVGTGDGDYPSWSPDGQHILFIHFNPITDVESLNVMNIDGSDLVQITPDSIDPADSAWSPDGTKIAYVAQDISSPTGKMGLWVSAPDGSGAHLIFAAPSLSMWIAWSPDSSRLVASQDYEQSEQTNTITVMNADGTHRNVLVHHGVEFPDFEEISWRS